MAKTKISCLNCKQECYVEIREINRGNGKFCTRKCSGEYNAKQRPKLIPNVTCALCHKNFYKNSSEKKVSKSGLFFCSRKCKDEAQKIGGIKEIMPSHYGTGSPITIYRRIAFENKPKICERCGYDTHPAAIIVHHKDRNRMNDDITNLEVLCCNCHAIEHWAES